MKTRTFYTIFYSLATIFTAAFGCAIMAGSTSLITVVYMVGFVLTTGFSVITFNSKWRWYHLIGLGIWPIAGPVGLYNIVRHGSWLRTS